MGCTGCMMRGGSEMGKVSRRVQSGEADQRRKQHAQRRQSTRSDVTLTFKRLLQLDCLDDLLNDRALARGLQDSVCDVGIVSRRGRFDGSQHVGQHIAGPSQQIALRPTVTTTHAMNNSRRRHGWRHHLPQMQKKCKNATTKNHIARTVTNTLTRRYDTTRYDATM